MIDAEDERTARIDALRREGRYDEAARLYLEVGDAARASALYAEVWDWPSAIRVAEEAGLYDVAYQQALASDDRPGRERLLEALASRPEQALRAAAHAETRNRPAEAARLYELAGDPAQAARRYESAGALFDAARCLESTGCYREAGLLYERRVREAPGDGEAALRLGRILAHFGRFEHAVRALQKAIDDPERAGGARRLMVACFAAMGMDEAAGSCLDVLRRDDPTLPITVPEFLRESFGDPRGLAALTHGGDEGEARLLAGRYRIVHPLGAGATGRVLLAHDGFYDREVAVKVLTIGTGDIGRDAYVRFAREARVAAGIDHPNVVRVHEFNPEGPFLVMEYMAGGTLEERLTVAGRLAPPLVRRVTLAVLRGLEAVHRRGVVHRDLKPANIFFGAAGQVKIGDFGVAHLTDLGATLTGALLGTLAYMAPEQITGAQRPDASTDLYALGVVLFRMLTGQLPFPGPDFVTQHLEGHPPAPSEVAPNLGDAYDALLAALLARASGDRLRSAAQVQARIEALTWATPERGDEPAVASPTAVGVAAVRPSSVPPPPSERYVSVETLDDGTVIALDTSLHRRVRIESCAPARAERLRRLARADSPHLQAVYSVDLEQGRAVIEQPLGQPLAEATELGARKAVRDDVHEALRRLHEEGLVHGEVGPSRVVVGRGRTVLLLPDGAEPPAEASADGDLAALDAL